MRPVLRRVRRLQHLSTFEAAARLGGFTAAGRELGIAQPAVTRQIHALERDIGTQLFRRSANRSELTEAGRRLYDSLDVAFSAIEHALVQITAGDDVFVLATTAGFSQHMIVPHLDELQAALGTRDLRLWLYDRDSELETGSYDAAIRVGAGGWPGHDSRELFTERVVPVAAPWAALEWGLDADSTVDAVAAAPLLRAENTERPWMSWEEWFAHFDRAAPAADDRLTFPGYSSIIQQAVAGRGLALGWVGLVEDLVGSGVVQPVGPVVTSDRGFHITWPRRRRSAAIVELVSWLQRETERRDLAAN